VYLYMYMSNLSNIHKKVLCKVAKPIDCGINIVKKVNYSTLAIVLEELNHFLMLQ
jgi:hypothetical protein